MPLPKILRDAVVQKQISNWNDWHPDMFEFGWAHAGVAGSPDSSVACTGVFYRISDTQGIQEVWAQSTPLVKYSRMWNGSVWTDYVMQSPYWS